ncbi:MAG: TonB-dependent siderophore receptor [Parahaliea sp.]
MFIKSPRFFKIAGSGLFMAAVQASSFSVVAQTSTDDENDNDQLEEVLVTGSYLLNEDIDMATGLGLTALETPQSVSVLTAQRILDQNLRTISDVVANAPGLSRQQWDNVRNTFTARGFSVDRYQIDGVPLPWSLAGNAAETIADMVLNERIEIVRGATGLMTGYGDPSASINLIRKHADAQELSGYMSLGAGRWDNYNVTADVGAPLAFDGAVRGRLVLKQSKEKSFQDYYEGESSVYYGVIDTDITDNTLLRVGASFQQNDPTGVIWGSLPAWYSDGRQAQWSQSKSTAAKWTQWSTENDAYFVNLIHTLPNGWRFRMDYNRLVNSWTTRLIYMNGVVDPDTGLLYNGIDDQGQPIETVPSLYRSKGESELNSFGFQLSGDFELLGQTHDFVLGSMHSDQTSEARTYAASDESYVSLGNFFEWDGGYPEPIWANETNLVQDQTTEEEGFYGALRLSLGEHLRFIAGARVTTWNQNGFAWSGPFDYGDDDQVIPYAGLLLDLDDYHRLYVSYTEIFKPQNARDADRNLLDPLVGKSSELGVKSAWLDGMLESTVAVFLIQQDNLAQDTGIMYPGTTETIYTEADGTESKGIEVEVVGSITDNWRMSASYTWFQAEDEDGYDVNTDVPRELLKLFSTYDINTKLTVGGGVNWQDKIYGGNLKQESYALVNLMARYNVNDNLSIQANVDNLFDEEYYSYLNNGGAQYRYGRPADYSVHVNYQF